MVFTKIKGIVRDEDGKKKNPEALTIDEAIDICKAKLKECCFVYAYGGSENHCSIYSQKNPASVKECPQDIRKRIETMLDEGKTVIIVYDNRYAEIKEGSVEEELAELSKKPTR